MHSILARVMLSLALVSLPLALSQSAFRSHCEPKVTCLCSNGPSPSPDPISGKTLCIAPCECSQ
ncbi:hypothetical protein PGT21_005902 [Puccinia graminis f. sp. tritici]|uniref:Extracellular membrane protein CFEM domain-containing protein n=1 Tax=Puccinia graminis f. sp. tritici TaxID=56615 RepID=A0A5B0QHQ7_PUCGR|nr:hypothetical protein PGT21_005902 [Puccinia graminis f. sp. tritici]